MSEVPEENVVPTRILREGILDSRAVNALSEPEEILYRRLMSIVDDHGRCEADPDLIRARCFPLQLERWPSVRVREVLIALRGSPLITVYHRGDKTYIQIENFGQRIQSKPKCAGPYDSGSVIEKKGVPFSTVGHGDSPPRASRARTKSESESESETAAQFLPEANTPEVVSLTVDSEKPTAAAARAKNGHAPKWPAAAEFLFNQFPNTDPGYEIALATLAQDAIRKAGGNPDLLTDLALRDALQTATFPGQKAASGYKRTLPNVVTNWSKK